MPQSTGNISGTPKNYEGQLFKEPKSWFSNLTNWANIARPAADAAAEQSKRVQGLLQSKVTSGNFQPGMVYDPNAKSVFQKGSQTTAPATTGKPTIATTPATTATKGAPASGLPKAPQVGISGMNTANPTLGAGPGVQYTGPAGIDTGLNAAPGMAGNTGEVSGAAGQAYLNNLQGIKDNSQFNPQTGTYQPYYTGQFGNVNPAASPTVAGLVPQLLGNAGFNPQVQQARQNIQALQDEYARQQGIIANSPVGLSVQGGEQGQLAQQYATKLSAAEQALANAQQEQQIQQQGLTSALGAVAPIGAQALGFYQPGTGQFTQYGGGQGGGAATAGAVGQQINQGASVQNLNATHKIAQTLAANLSNAIDQAKINNIDLGVGTTFASGIRKWIDTNSGDPKYQNFANLVNEVAQKYAAILNQAGGTPTDQSQLSHSIINGLASGQNIKTVLASLDKNAGDSIDALKSASGANAYSAGAGQQEIRQSAGGYNWVFKNGKWEVAQ